MKRLKELNISPYYLYDGLSNAKTIWVSSDYSKKTQELLEELNIKYTFDELCTIDHNDNMCYITNGNEKNIIFTIDGYIGRVSIDTFTAEELDEIVLIDYINSFTKALPTWINKTLLIKLGWIKKSCKFTFNLQDNNGNPKEIKSEIENKYDTLFQISNSGLTKVEFCVWVKRHCNK